MFRRNFINLAAFAFSAPAFAQIYGDKSDDYDLIVVGSGLLDFVLRFLLLITE